MKMTTGERRGVLALAAAMLILIIWLGYSNFRSSRHPVLPDYEALRQSFAEKADSAAAAAPADTTAASRPSSERKAGKRKKYKPVNKKDKQQRPDRSSPLDREL